MGRDALSGVSDEYPEGAANTFNCTIDWVETELGDDSHDHLINPDDLLRAMLSRQ